MQLKASYIAACCSLQQENAATELSITVITVQNYHTLTAHRTPDEASQVRFIW